MNIFIYRHHRLFSLLPLLIILLFPFIVGAQQASGDPAADDFQLVPDCGPSGMCGYCNLMTLAGNIMNFLIYFAVFVAVFSLVYAGFLYLTGGANPGQISKAHSVFRTTIIGFIVVLAAWLIVNIIVVNLFNTEITDPWTLEGCEGYGNSGPPSP